MADLSDAVTAYLAALDNAYAAEREREGYNCWQMPDHRDREEFARWCRKSDETRARVRTADARLCAANAALRAAVAADTGWRDRPPTAEEVAAHALAHPCDDGCGSWLHRYNGHVEVVALNTRNAAIFCAYGRDRSAWRPLTASGDPAPWPEVTP